MTPFSRWLRERVERWLGRWHEGVDFPARLGEEVAAFARLHPQATAEEWAWFARTWSAETYRVGFVRGYEHCERREDWRPDPLPEVVADHEAPGWRDSPPVELDADPGA